MNISKLLEEIKLYEIAKATWMDKTWLVVMSEDGLEYYRNEEEYGGGYVDPVELIGADLEANYEIVAEMIDCEECDKEKAVEKGTWALDKNMCERCYYAYQGG